MAISKPNLTRIWAADAAGSDVVDPDVQTPGKFALGWGAEKPPYQFFNFMQKLFTQGLGYFDEQGIGFWNTDTDYQDLSLTKGSDGTLYLLKVGGDGTIDPVVDAGTNWTQLPTRAEVDAKAAISGQVFTGNVTAPNLSGTNTGDQDLSGKANVSGQTFTGNISANNLSGTNTGDQTNISGNAATVSTITTTQVGDATAGLAAGAIGSYAFLKNNTGGTRSFGSNASGGSLVPATANGSSAGSVTGTWQCRGFGANTDQTNWLRIS